MTSYYIYYKVAAAQVERVRSATDELQRTLAAKTGVRGRLLCRRDQPDTWMEVYENIADEAAFDTTLKSALERLRFAELLGPEACRVTEIFRPL